MVKGLREFERAWGSIPKVVRKNVIAEMEDIAQDIVDLMYSQAPQLTGDMAGSISWTWGDAPKGSLVIGQVGGGREYATLRITIYAGGGKTFYARFQEFGTADMAANPFFFPVWKARKRSVKARLTRAVKKAIRLAS